MLKALNFYVWDHLEHLHLLSIFKVTSSSKGVQLVKVLTLGADANLEHLERLEHLQISAEVSPLARASGSAHVQAPFAVLAFSTTMCMALTARLRLAWETFAS